MTQYYYSQELSHLFDLNSKSWKAPDISTLTPYSVQKLAEKHQLIANHYKFLRTMIATEKEDQSRQLRIKQHKAALFLAELLEQLHRGPCKELHSGKTALQGTIKALQKQQAALRKSLNEDGFRILNFDEPALPATSFSLIRTILNNHPELNAIRLLLARLRRMMFILHRIRNVASGYKTFIQKIDWIVLPIFTHLGWIAFIPRLASNLWRLFKHTIPGFWMSQEEKRVGAWTRFWTQLKETWPALGNDTGWFLCGVMGAFVLSVTAASYFTLAMFFLDVILSGIRCSLGLVDLYLMKERLNPDNAPDPVKAEAMKSLITAIDAHIEFETKRMQLTIANSVLLFLAMSLTLPGMIALSPLTVLIVSAVLVFAISFAVFIAGKILDRQAPLVEAPQPASGVTTFGFFGNQQEEYLEDCKDETLYLPFEATSECGA